MYVIVAFTFSHPTTEVIQLARDIGFDGKVQITSCGNNNSNEEEEINQLLIDSMQFGHWLIIQNAHLSQQWSQTCLLFTLQVSMSL